MGWMKDIMLEAARRRSEREAARLAGEFARAASEEREEILAALQFEQWMAEACLDCQNGTSEPEIDGF
jgi:hypothetical protein